MGKVNLDNPYRKQWCEETEAWLKRNGYTINPHLNEKFPCPRCGVTKIMPKDKIQKSQFGYRVCFDCYEDEIITDSLGVEQIKTQFWYVFSKQNLI